MAKILNIKDEWRNCIESCTNCHNVCLEAVAYSLKKGGELNQAKHITILCDCIDVCQASINSMSRNSELANKICVLCANICNICAEHCEKFDDEKLNECATVCRDCAKECIKMAAVPV